MKRSASLLLASFARSSARIPIASWSVRRAISRPRKSPSRPRLPGISSLPPCTPTTRPGAIARLIDMGVEPFLISSTLDAVLGQRLLRSICPDCRTAYQPNESLLAELDLSPDEIGDRRFYYGKGCENCNRTGYKGRKGIYELMRITRSHSCSDQRANALGHFETKGDRARHGDAAAGRHPQHFRGQHDDRGSAEIYLKH